MKHSSKNKWRVLFLLVSGLLSGSVLAQALSIEVTHYLDENGMEEYRLNCSLNDSVSECEITKKKNNFEVDKKRIAIEIAKNWLSDYFSTAGLAAVKGMKEVTKSSDFKVLQWQIQDAKKKSSGLFNRSELNKPLSKEREQLRQSLFDIETKMSFEFAKTK